MDLRTHVWGASTTAAILVVAAVAAVGWLRPLPSREASAYARVQAAWAAHERGELSAEKAAAVLRGLAASRPGFGEAAVPDDAEHYDRVHELAIQHLGRLQTPAALTGLCELALDQRRHVNLYAVEALRRRGDKAALPTLLAVLAHDDQRQKRLDDHFARVTQETLRALRDLADGPTLQALRQFVDADRRMFDQDIRRTIQQIARDMEAPVDAVRRDASLLEADEIDSIFRPSVDRLGGSSLLGMDGLVQPTGGASPLLLPMPAGEAD